MRTPRWSATIRRTLLRVAGCTPKTLISKRRRNRSEDLIENLLGSPDLIRLATKTTVNSDAMGENWFHEALHIVRRHIITTVDQSRRLRGTVERHRPTWAHP